MKCIFIAAVLLALSLGSAFAAPGPAYVYFKEWSAKMLWVYGNDTFNMQAIFDYDGNQYRMDFINPTNGDLPNGGSAQSSILQVNHTYYEFDNGNDKLCSTSSAPGSIDPEYPGSLKLIQYAGFGFAPYVGAFGLHYSNVTLGSFWADADIWVDPYTQYPLYVAPSIDQDLGFFVFLDFKPYIDPNPNLFRLPTAILVTCI